MTFDRRKFLIATAIFAVAPLPAFAVPCCGPISPAGAKLAAFLDGSNVDRLWLPGSKVNWETGASISVWDDDKPHTHCSAFVASAAKRLGVYVLRPPEHSAVLLANAQMGWLGSRAAVTAGWRPIGTVLEAQRLANGGDLVVAAFENPDPTHPGHIAIIRPSTIDQAALMAVGPFVTQAGGHNAISEPLAHGFGNHPGAWNGNGSGGVRFFAHSVDWSKV